MDHWVLGGSRMSCSFRGKGSEALTDTLGGKGEADLGRGAETSSKGGDLLDGLDREGPWQHYRDDR